MTNSRMPGERAGHRAPLESRVSPIACTLRNVTSLSASCWRRNWNCDKQRATFFGRKSTVARFPELSDKMAVIFRRVVKCRRLGDYELQDELGRGGMGVVYKARQVHLNQVVAMKVLPERYLDEPQAVARFKREMQSIGALEHPNIVRAYNAGEANGVYFLAMEFVDGIDLQRLIMKPSAKTAKPLSVGAACEAIRQAALGLHHAHEHNLVHRDIKPANLMLSRSGVVKLLDLGLAKFHADRLSPDQRTGNLTQAGITMGTVDYMAPEQWENSGGVDIRADIYSLGCTLFYLLVGRAPYGGESYDSNRKKLMAHVVAPIPSLIDACPECPEELEEVFDRILAKEPEDRYASPAKWPRRWSPLPTPTSWLAGQPHLTFATNQPLLPSRRSRVPWLRPTRKCPATRGHGRPAHGGVWTDPGIGARSSWRRLRPGWSWQPR